MTALTLIPGQLSLAQLRDIYQQPVTLSLDASASAYEQIYVSGGRRGFDIGLAPSDLLAVTGGRSAAIAR